LKRREIETDRRWIQVELLISAADPRNTLKCANRSGS
jgi:hypothetical protein